MLRHIGLTGLLMLLAAALPAADLTGNWKGQFTFQGDPVPLTLHLKASGDSLTGTVEGMPTTPAEIKEGKILGDSVTFWVLTDYEGTSYKIVYKGKISGDEIRFTLGTEDGGWAAELIAKKA